MIRRQKIWLAIVVAVNLALWLIPSDVVEEIARQRQVLLGRTERRSDDVPAAVAADLIGCGRHQMALGSHPARIMST